MPPQYPPFGFSVFFDRHHGRRWCWKDRRDRQHPDDVREGFDLGSRREAIEASRAELRRRGERAGTQ